MSHEENLVEIIRISLDENVRMKYRFKEFHRALKRMLLIEALKKCDGNIKKTADMMGLKRTTVSEMVESCALRDKVEELKNEAISRGSAIYKHQVPYTVEQRTEQAKKAVITRSLNRKTKYSKLFPY
jgi:hypothetical protein